MAITFKGSGATTIKVLDLSTPGAQGAQGDPGVSADEPTQWTLSLAADITDVYPVAGQIKLYDALAFQVAINETTSAGGKVGGWLTSLRSIYMGGTDMTMAVVSVADPNTYSLCSVLSVSPLYETNGSFSSIVTSTILEQSGELGEGDPIEIMFFRLGADGARGYQGAFGPQGSQGALTGAQGPQGYMGQRGVTGHPGDKGHQGPQGAQGSAVQGPQGPTGVTGDEGPQGYQGYQGHPGNQGYQGIPGQTGVQGTTGHQGEGAEGYQGHQGAPGGAQGPQGHPGARGSQGSQGNIGSEGQRGTQGVQGDPGPQGPQGYQGVQGTAGVQGYDGAQGIQGEPGGSGNAGNQGPQGYQGDRGLGFVISKIYNSVAELELEGISMGGNVPGNGEFGLVAGSLSPSHADYGKLYLWTTSGGWSLKTDMSISGYQGLRGSQGAQGPTGDQGAQGTPTTGPQGYRGTQGVQGDPGYIGYQGPSVGYRGNQGAQGATGTDGSSIYSASGTGLIYVSSNVSETITVGTGLSTDGTSGTRSLFLAGAKSRPAIDVNHVHVYNCDETSGTTLTDSGSGAKNATLLGTLNTDYSFGSYGAGRVTRAIRFLADATATGGARTARTCSISGGKVTLECVAMRIDAPGANQMVATVDASSDGDFTDGIYITANSSGCWFAGIRMASGSWYETSYSAAPIAYGVAQHLMAVYDPSASPTFKFYVDGLLVSSTAASGTLATMTRVTVGTFAAAPIAWGSASCKSHIRDVRVSNIARSASYALSSANALLAL